MLFYLIGLIFWVIYIYLLKSEVLFVLIYFGVCFFNLWYWMVFRYYMIGYVCVSESGCIFGLKIKYLFLC